MSSWVQLLLALLAACPRFGVAEGEPLPAALVELVRNTPISSIEDLQLLLLTDSVDEEDEDEAAIGGHRVPRSLNAQLAQHALCKVRTEVEEVTRAMLDSSNANFLLWPPCVEVQRCSGCCNTKSQQCVPVATHIRHLQVMKIEYVNKRPMYAKVVVSVVDHVECRCQDVPRLPTPKKKSSGRQHGLHLRNRTVAQDHELGKGHRKDDLHQWDELKHNQRVQLEDLLEQHWNTRGDTFTQPVDGYSQTGADKSLTGEAVLLTPHWTHNSTRPTGTNDQTGTLENRESKDGRILDDNKTVPSVDRVSSEVKKELEESENGHLLTQGDEEDGEKMTPSMQEDKKLSKGHTDGFAHHVTRNPQAGFGHTEAGRSWLKPTKEPNPDPRERVRQRDNETPEEVQQEEEDKVEREREELLLLHKKLDQEKEILRQKQLNQEGEERQKGKKTESHPQSKHHHHPQTTQAPATTGTTTRQPSPPAGPRPPAHPKKKRRRNRKRISKAAMRAMLM
ncbi:uncharacterized protein pdgfbb isoform X1 [Takifugu flavidus]|nr:uncharacterized protein pdgfbb isoform X1 [Takifugu flavidus]